MKMTTAISKAWEENLKLDKDYQWESKEDIIDELCPHSDEYKLRLKGHMDKDNNVRCEDFKDDGKRCTRCWNTEIEENNEKEISISIDNKLEFSPISDINLDDANEDGLKESLKRNDYIVCAHNSFDYNKIPIFIKWLQEVYNYCTELKNKVEYVDFIKAKKHMKDGRNAYYNGAKYNIKDVFTIDAIESDKWILD